MAKKNPVMYQNPLLCLEDCIAIGKTQHLDLTRPEIQLWWQSYSLLSWNTPLPPHRSCINSSCFSHCICTWGLEHLRWRFTYAFNLGLLAEFSTRNRV